MPLAGPVSLLLLSDLMWQGIIDLTLYFAHSFYHCIERIRLEASTPYSWDTFIFTCFRACLFQFSGELTWQEIVVQILRQISFFSL